MECGGEMEGKIEFHLSFCSGRNKNTRARAHG
jgi:hypothetical protein